MLSQPVFDTLLSPSELHAIDREAAEARQMLGYVEDDGYLIQAPPDEDVERALDEIPQTSFKEAIEALQAAPPIQEPVRLTRQSARRIVIQLLDARLKENGVPRADRRRLIFWRGQSGKRAFDISSLARQLVTSPPEPASPPLPAFYSQTTQPPVAA